MKLQTCQLKRCKNVNDMGAEALFMSIHPEVMYMLKKLLLAVGAMVAATGFAFAQVDVNKADQVALDGVRGVGPKMSKTILDERKTGGNFKDWADFESRVKGVGPKSAVRLSDAGLTVNGQPRPAGTADAAKTEKKEKAAAKK